MENQEKKTYYSISEVAEKLKLTYSYLHFLEGDPFKIEVKKNSKKTRFYTQENIYTIQQIIYLTKTQGYSLKVAAEKLKTVGELLPQKNRMIDDLKSTREFLIALREELSKKI